MNTPNMSESNVSEVFGIDLGTTNSCIAMLKKGRAEIIPIENNNTMPSVVAYRDGEWLVGSQARNYAFVDPTAACISIKRKMDEPNSTVLLGNQTQTPIEISAQILKSLKDRAQEATGCDVSRVVITVPAWFQDPQRQATIAAGQLAGLEVLQVINEPTAAALAYDNSNLPIGSRQQWLVYDLGGGTFDASVLSISPSSREVLASVGSCWLGGDDFDHRLVERFVDHLRQEQNIDPREDVVAMARLSLLAETTKIRLSSETEVNIDEPLSIQNTTTRLSITLTRTDFEELIADLIEATIDKARESLDEAGLRADELDKIVLVGGSTRIPMVADALREHLGMEADCHIDADLSVGMGAAIAAAIQAGTVLEQSVVDVSPHSLGIAVVGELDRESMGVPFNESDDPLSFLPLIRRNSRLPASFVRTVFKQHSNQKYARIAVYQGESSLIPENTFVGAFLADLPQSSDQRLDISFAYDESGTVRVAVLAPGTSQAIKTYSIDLSQQHTDTESRFVEEAEEVETADHTSDHTSDHTGIDTAATNYLVNKITKALSSADASTQARIEPILQDYRLALTEQRDDDVDALEEALFEWLDDADDASSNSSIGESDGA